MYVYKKLKNIIYICTYVYIFFCSLSKFVVEVLRDSAEVIEMLTEQKFIKIIFEISTNIIIFQTLFLAYNRTTDTFIFFLFKEIRLAL